MKTPTTDYEPILKLAAEGFSALEILEKLGLTISKRQVQKIVQESGLSRPHERGGRLDQDHVQPILRDIIDFCLIEYRGLDPYECSECGRRTVKKCDVHHTKYEGATIFDLAYLCRRCNTSPRNVGLL